MSSHLGCLASVFRCRAQPCDWRALAKGLTSPVVSGYDHYGMPGVESVSTKQSVTLNQRAITLPTRGPCRRLLAEVMERDACWTALRRRGKGPNIAEGPTCLCAASLNSEWEWVCVCKQDVKAGQTLSTTLLIHTSPPGTPVLDGGRGSGKLQRGSTSFNPFAARWLASGGKTARCNLKRPLPDNAFFFFFFFFTRTHKSSSLAHVASIWAQQAPNSRMLACGPSPVYSCYVDSSHIAYMPASVATWWLCPDI